MDPVRIGNDVLDLEDPRLRGRLPGDRFEQRVVSPPEHAFLETSGVGDRLFRLWALWASKETAYKVLSKDFLKAAPFVPRSLVCSLRVWEEGPAGPLHVSGTVRRDETARPRGARRDPGAVVTVTGASDGRHLHVFGWSGGGERPSGGRLEADLDSLKPGAPDLSELGDRFTPSEWAGIRSHSSAVVRLLARERVRAILTGDSEPSSPQAGAAAEILSLDASRRRTAPYVAVGGVPLPGWDLSLSHHGRYVAWALLVPET